MKLILDVNRSLTFPGQVKAVDSASFVCSFRHRKIMLKFGIKFRDTGAKRLLSQQELNLKNLVFFLFHTVGKRKKLILRGGIRDQPNNVLGLCTNSESACAQNNSHLIETHFKRPQKESEL